MLQRLLGRSKIDKEEALDPALPDDANSPELGLVLPFDPTAPEQPMKIKRKRDAVRSRASDVRDEEGRTAEQIAEESSKDFDIMAVARLAQDLPETGERPAGQPAAAEPSRKPTKTPGVTSVASETETLEIIELDQSDPGHIVMPGADLDAQAQTKQARNAFWAKWGSCEKQLIGYDTNPQALGAPAWPNTRQNFRVVRTEGSLIIASEGLSDPFGPFSDGGTTNGFGMEVFIDVVGWQEMPLCDVKSTWAFLAIEHVARVTAKARGLREKLEENRMLSVDLPYAAIPREWGDLDEPMMPGGLFGLPLPPRMDVIAGTPLSSVRAVPLTMITPEELESCLIGGAEERQLLANDLMTTGVGHRSAPVRMSLR